MVKSAVVSREAAVELARVLLVDDAPASRLTLQTVLQASGYRVRSAASAAEALRMLEEEEYELVITALHLESPEAGHTVLAHARMMDYRPAVALITSHSKRLIETHGRGVLIQPEEIPALLTKVADLISERASRKLHRELRHQNAGAAP